MRKLYTKSNSLMSANVFDIEDKDIICNNVILPAEFDESSGYSPNVRMWLIGHAYGPVCAIFSVNEQDALDDAADAGMLDCMRVSAEDTEDCDYENSRNNYEYLGNASEAFDLGDCWIAEVDLQPARDIKLIVKLARASEGGYDTLVF